MYLKHKELACCYFPTTTIIVDDDATFTKSMNAMLDTDLEYETYNDPVKALEFLEKKYRSLLKPGQWTNNLLNQSIDVDELNPHDSSIYNIKLSEIHKLVFNPQRFKEISTVISDYSMSELNGIEFFEKLKHFNFQKFLLTGAATESVGVQAFNQGIINKFELKVTTPEFEKLLNNSIRELQLRYFVRLSNEIMQHLSPNKNSCIGESLFEKLFNKLVSDNNIVEYYLLNSTGSFLMIDYEGNPSFLAVHSEENMQYYYDSAVDNEASNQIIEALKNREHGIFLFSEQDDDAPYEEWTKYLHPAKILEGEKNKFYYSYIKNNPVYDSQLEKIVSYKDFLEKGLASS